MCVVFAIYRSGNIEYNVYSKKMHMIFFSVSYSQCTMVYIYLWGISSAGAQSVTVMLK